MNDYSVALIRNNKETEEAEEADCRYTLIKCAIEHCHPQKEAESEVRYYNSFHYIMYGSGIIEKDGKKYTLNRGDSFLLFRGEQYTYYPVRQDPWSYIYVDFYMDGFDSFWKNCGFTKETFINTRHDEGVLGILQDMCEAFKGRDSMPLKCEGLFMLLLSRLLEKNDLHERLKKTKNLAKKQICDEVIIFINNNYRMQISLNEIASATGFSSGYISAVMSKEMGWSPIQYLNVYRIANACKLLRSTDMSIREIAAEVGYSDPLYFSRMFSKLKGCSPSKYRVSLIADNPFAFLTEKNIDFR